MPSTRQEERVPRIQLADHWRSGGHFGVRSGDVARKHVDLGDVVTNLWNHRTKALKHNTEDSATTRVGNEARRSQ